MHRLFTIDTMKSCDRNNPCSAAAGPHAGGIHELLVGIDCNTSTNKSCHPPPLPTPSSCPKQKVGRRAEVVAVEQQAGEGVGKG